MFRMYLIATIIFCSLFIAHANASNYVQLSDSNRYFQLEDGSDFLPLGHNEGIDWPYLINIYPTLTVNGVFGEYDPVILRDYFDTLHDHGVNVIRIMTDDPQPTANYLDPPDSIQLEEPIGSFNPRVIRFLDDMFEIAADYDIYFMLTPYDTYWMNFTWDPNHYNSANGGPVHARHDFLTERRCLEYQKERIKFLIDRYGNSDRIFAWDFMNELNIWWDSSEAEELEFTNQLTSWLTQYERETWGKNHLVCISTAGPEHSGDLGYAVYQHPNVDFPTTHFYYGEGTPPWPAQPSVANPETAPGSGVYDGIIAPVQVNTGIRYALSQIPADDPRPFLDSESGPITYVGGGSSTPSETPQTLPLAFDNMYHHNMIWAHLASGGAGSGLRWPMRFPLHTMSDGMLDNLQAMNRIGKNIRWATFNSENIDTQISVSNTGGHDVIDMGCSDGITALVFIIQDTRSTTGVISGASLQVSGMQAGDYDVLVFDSYTGDLLSQTTQTAAAGTVTTPLPDFELDHVVILKHTTATPTVNRKPEGYITYPKAGMGTGAGTIVTITADAWDTDGTLTRVEFYANYDDGGGKAYHYLGQDTTAPYELAWDTTGIADQEIDLTIDVYDDGGHAIRPAHMVRGVMLEASGGDQTPPVGSLAWPPHDATIYSPASVTLKAGAWDASSGVKRVQWFIQGTPADPGAATNTYLGAVTEPPYELTVDLSAYDGTTRWISCDVIDNATPEQVAGPADLHGNILFDSTSSDPTSPSAQLLTPSAGEVITSTPINLSADAYDPKGIQKLAFYCFYDGGWHWIGEDTTAPYTLSWNPPISTSQKIAFTVDAINIDGKYTAPAGAAGGIYYSVPQGDRFTPWAHLSEPLSYGEITLPATIHAIAGDENSGVAQVTFKYKSGINWHVIGIDTTAPYSVDWDTTLFEVPTEISLAVDVIDHDGNFLSQADVKEKIMLYPREAPVLTITGSVTCTAGGGVQVTTIGSGWDAQDANGALNSILSGAPAGLSVNIINTNGSLEASVSATLAVAPGTYPIQLTLRDNDTNEDVGSFDVTVEAPPNTAPLATITAGIAVTNNDGPVSRPIATIDDNEQNAGDLLVSISSSLPTGISATVSNQAGTVVAEVEANGATPGDYWLELTVDDGQSLTTQVDFLVRVGDEPNQAIHWEQMK